MTDHSDATAVEASGDKTVYLLQHCDRAGADVHDIDFRHMVGVILRRKWWIAAFTMLAACVGIAYALLATPWYRAEAVLMPRDGGVGSGLSSTLAQFGGLAELAGVSLGRNSTQEPLGVLNSKGFARRFIERNNLVDVLTEGNTPETGPLEQANASHIRDRAVDEFTKSVLDISENSKTGLVTVGVEWKDAAIAASWANAITRQVNDEMRLRALAEATRNIDYLRDQLEKTDAVSLQQAIARLLEAEMQKVMMAKGADEYSFRVIDAAQPAANPERPKRKLVVVVSLIAGLFISTLVVLMVDPIREAFADTAEP